MHAVLYQQHGQVLRRHRAERDQRTHVHEYRTVALDRDHAARRLRHRKPNRQRQR